MLYPDHCLYRSIVYFYNHRLFISGTLFLYFNLKKYMVRAGLELAWSLFEAEVLAEAMALSETFIHFLQLEKKLASVNL